MAGSDNAFLGGLVVGLLASFILYGIFVAQAYLYSFNSKEDPNWMKCLVSIVVMLETLNTVFMFMQMYHYLIIGFGRLDIVEKVHWTVAGIVITENIAVALVQGFFVYRVWILSDNSRGWVIAMSIPVLAQFASIIVGAVDAVTTKTWVEYQARTENKVGVNLGNITSVVADTAVAVAMVYHLRRSKTYFKRTDSVLRWLIVYSVNTGIMTLLIALAILISYARVKDSLIYAGLVVVSGKMCAISMLGALNARHTLRKRLNDNTSVESALSASLRFRGGGDQISPVVINMPPSELATVTRLDA